MVLVKLKAVRATPFEHFETVRVFALATNALLTPQVRRAVQVDLKAGQSVNRGNVITSSPLSSRARRASAAAEAFVSFCGLLYCHGSDEKFLYELAFLDISFLHASRFPVSSHFETYCIVGPLTNSQTIVSQ